MLGEKKGNFLSVKKPVINYVILGLRWRSPDLQNFSLICSTLFVVVVVIQDWCRPYLFDFEVVC